MIEATLEKGMEKGIREVAKSMLAKGVEITLISDVTGLSEKEINDLK